MGGAAVVLMCACFAKSLNQNLRASCFSWFTSFLHVLKCKSRESRVPGDEGHVKIEFVNVPSLHLKLFR